MSENTKKYPTKIFYSFIHSEDLKTDFSAILFFPMKKILRLIEIIFISTNPLNQLIAAALQLSATKRLSRFPKMSEFSS